MGTKPFSHTSHREYQWITPLELVADCIMTGRGIVVCVHVKGKEHGSLFQPYWKYQDSGKGTRYLLFNGSHYDNIGGEEPFMMVNRKQGDRTSLHIRLPSDSSGSNGHDSGNSSGSSYSGEDSDHNDDGSSDSSSNDASDDESDDGDASNNNSGGDGNTESNNSSGSSGSSNSNGSNSVTISGGSRGSSTHAGLGSDPVLFIGKIVIDYFDGDHNIGEVKSFKSLGGDCSPTSVYNGILFLVRFDNDLVREYCHSDLLPLLVHGEGKYSGLTHKAWLHAKKTYKTISDALHSGTASARTPDFMKSIFDFRPNTVITKQSMRQKLNARNRELHSDRTSRLPSNVQHVAKGVLSALRYFLEHYISIYGGPPPSIDAPTSADFPPYNSPEFAARCAVQGEDLTQDPFIPPTPANDHDGGGEVLDDPDGKDIPVESSAFDRVDFEISNMVDGLEAIDHFNLADTLLNPFKLLSLVSPSSCEEWASAYALAAKQLIQACERPSNDPLRRIQILRSVKWYCILPQVIFRNPNRDKERNIQIVNFRLRQFLSGNFRDLLGHWFKDVHKERLRARRQRAESSEKLLARAVNLILCGDIGRGLRLIDSNGVSSQEDPQVREQMRKKHPSPDKSMEWPDLPQDWIQVARDKIDFGKPLERVLNDADPKAGVGPRGLHIHYLQVLAKGSFSNAEAQNAFPLLASLGKLYLTLGLPAWVRLCLGSGLLTALNKVAPKEGTTPDARPVRAEDADTGSWCKALARITAPSVRDATGPHQLGVGVSGGVELYGIGFKMRFEDAVRNGIEKGLVKIDVKNAHNSFPKDDAQRRTIEAAQTDPRLIPLAVAGASILRLPTPIYMRDYTSPTKFDLLCEGLKGGGQGNALTGQFYVINQDPALKAVQAKFPNVDIKAIQDDITIFGDPDDLFDETDDEGRVIEVGALTLLDVKLKDCGHECNLTKFACVGTTPDACAKKPSWLSEPTSIQTTDGSIIQARGIDICNNPIGEDLYVETFLANKLESICKAIKHSSDSLSVSSHHANFLAFYHSYQARFDYWMATNNLVFTGPLALKLDAFLRDILNTIAGFDIFEPPPEGTPLLSFTEERVALKLKNSGLGFRLYKHRYLLLNSMNNVLPQAIDRLDENGNLIKGLWNSLSSLLGTGSFDDANKDQCWAGFHASDSSFASDHQNLICVVKNRYLESHTTLAIDPPDCGIFTASDSCFGYGIKKLHKAIQDTVREFDYQIVQSLADSMSGDDQRRITFCSTHNNSFANSFPLALAPETSMRFSLQEFVVAMARKLGAPIPQLLAFVGTTIRSEGKSHKVRVDQFGNGVASAPGVRGGYVTTAHNWIQRDAMKQVAISGVPVMGDSPFNTCNRVFGNCLNLGGVTRTDDPVKNLQKLIPDGVVSRFDLDVPFETPPNRLDGCETLVEVKTLAALTMTPNARAQKFQSDVEKRVHDLDSKYPGSTFSQRLKSHGKDGRYLVLVVGPFANLSDDFMVLCDFLGRVRAFRAINRWNINPKHALAINRHILITRFGHLAALMWARLILSRFRDAVLPDSTFASADSSAYFNAFTFGPSRGVYQGRYVPGA